MKVKELREILDTTRPIADYGDYIAVGSPMCHDLLRVDKDSVSIKYALDNSCLGREALTRVNKPDDLLRIWDKLQELIDSGKLAEIIQNDDEVTSECYEVFSYEDGKIIKSFAYELGWPNTTTGGQMMWENTHFSTYEEAYNRAVISEESSIAYAERKINEYDNKIAKLLEDRESAITRLSLLAEDKLKNSTVED